MDFSMTDIEQPHPIENPVIDPGEKQSDKTSDISRGSGFQRFSADNALFFPLGHDVEISFLIGEPVPKKRIFDLDEDGDESGESFKLERQIEEIARVRMPPSIATKLALNILARQASDDRFLKEGLAEQFDEILDLIPDPDETSLEDTE